MISFINKKRIAIIQAGTQVIEANTFDRCTSLESVVIPIGVSKIEDYAFNHCTSLTTVILPFSVTEIGEYSFDGCAKLATIYVPADMVEPVRNKLLSMGLHVKIVRRDMDWDEAIRKVLAKKGSPMRAGEIVKEIIEQGYRIDYGNTPEGTVGTVLRDNKHGWFKIETRGLFNLVGTCATTHHSHKTIGRSAPVVVRPSTSYHPSDPNYKKVSDITDFQDLSKQERDLLELIVNFRLKDEVCFADILDDLPKVEFSDEMKPPRQSDVDAASLRNKLAELKKQIAKIENKIKNDPKLKDSYGPLLNRMRSAAEKAEDLLANSGDKVVVDRPLLGEFVLEDESKPKVVIYYKNIERICRERWTVMAGVFVHEMLHAWNYFNARGESSVLAIDEPMVEFGTLYFLKELKIFTESQSHDMKGEVLCVSLNHEWIVQNKQKSIGDLAAYGFGFYLFENLTDADSINWIETYSEKSASITESDESVKKAKEALIPMYPFTSEKKVMEWFREIILEGYAISATTGKSAAAKAG